MLEVLLTEASSVRDLAQDRVPEKPKQLFLRISTEEQSTTQAYDTFYIQVVANNQTATLRQFSNLQAGPECRRQTVNLTPYRGQSIRIQFIGTEDNGSWTNFLVDDVAIVIEP